MTDIIKTAAEAATESINNTLAGKKWYASKTVWANIITVAAIAIQSYWGYVVDPSIQTLALAVVNVVLRKVTKEPLSF
jgi:hypothetical protein